MCHRTTADANTSTNESRPKATSASDLAEIPRPTVTKNSPMFHAIVRY
jgi:hypothetical protein